MRRFVCSALLAFASVASLAAQEKLMPVAWQFGAGFVQGIGHTGRDVEMGWSTIGGAGFNFGGHFTTMINLSTNNFTVAQTIPENFGVEGGHLNTFSATLDPVVHLLSGRHADVYFTGGGGLYRRGFTPSGPAGATVIPHSYSVNKPGVDVGLGLAFGTKWHGKIFAEARYNRIFDHNRFFTNYLPVNFGYRW